MLSIFSCSYWSSVYLLWRNVYLGRSSAHFLKGFYLFVYFWLFWVFVAVQLFSSCGTWDSHCSGFSCCRAGSRVRSVQFSCSVVSDSLWPHGLQHTRLPCPSPTPGACSNSFPLSQWCHPTISSPVIPFSSCLHSFPTLGAFLMSQPLASSGQNTGVSPSSEYSRLISFSTDWFELLVGCMGFSNCSSWALEHTINSCGTQA